MIARAILDSEFAESLHADICAAVGLDVEALELNAAVERVGRLDELRRRSATFRDDVLVAYEYRCAVCGYDGQLERQPVGLDAAHVRWWAFDGPDSVDNGVCLCALHHKLFDRGAIGISDNMTVMVSRRFVGRGDSSQGLVLSLVDRPLVRPQAGEPRPRLEHVRWHTDEVFRSPARSVAAPA